MLRGILGTGGSAPVGGSGAPGTIPVWSGSGTTLTDSQLIQSATAIYTTTRYFGVGTGSSAASAPLHVFGPAADWTAKIQGSTTSGSSYGLLIRAGTTSADTALSVQGPTGTPSLLFVRGDGNVGIGTAGPGAKLDVFSSDVVASTTSSQRLVFTGAKAANAGSSIGFGGYFTGTTPTIYSYIVGASDTATAGDFGGHMQFWTRPNGGAYGERMRIDSSGRQLVGTTSSPAYSSVKLVVNSAGGVNQYLYDSGSSRGIYLNAYNSGGSGLLEIGGVSGALGAEGLTNYMRISATAIDASFISGYGLKLPATPGNADTQTLDAYQENGSWTPTLSGFGGTAPTVTSARWTRMGRMVFCELLLSSTGTFSSTVGTTTVSAPATAAVEAAVPTNFSGGNSGVGAQSGTTVYLPTVASSTLARITWQFSV